uniref:TSC22 domain family member 1 n=1 Tax=Zonotrichia albicollis TaxID=44394 RepID=A0A8D2M124_ZONAL
MWFFNCSDKLLTQLLWCKRSSYRQQNRASDGSGKESLDVRCKGGSGGPQRANQRADREELAAGAREHSAKNTCQPRAACPVPSTAADWFSAFLFPVTRDSTAACSASITGLRAFSIAPDVIATVIAGFWTVQGEED